MYLLENCFVFFPAQAHEYTYFLLRLFCNFLTEAMCPLVTASTMLLNNIFIRWQQERAKCSQRRLNKRKKRKRQMQYMQIQNDKLVKDHKPHDNSKREREHEEFTFNRVLPLHESTNTGLQMYSSVRFISRSHMSYSHRRWKWHTGTRSSDRRITQHTFFNHHKFQL